MQEINYENLGAIEREPQVSDFHLGSFTTENPIPESYNIPFQFPIEMQGKQPACGAHAGAYLKDQQDNTRLSPAYLWKKIKQIDGFPAEDGTDMLSIMKALKASGDCSFDLLGNDVSVDLNTYKDPSAITQEMDTDAQNHRISTYAFNWNPSFDELKRAIYEHGPVIMLLRVGSEWWTDKNGNGSWQEKDILPLRANNPITSGHFVVATGYDKDYIYFVNEWSENWGRNGYGYFGEDYMYRCVEIGTAVDADTKYVFSKVLKIGSHGTDVGMLQKKLKDLGFFPASQSITSFFGSITYKAVQAFQRANGLTPDGIVGPKTNAVLNNL